MRHKTKSCLGIIIFVVFFWLHEAKAQNSVDNNSYEARAIHAFLTYCLPALTAGDSVSRVAEMAKLPELPLQEEKDFLKKPGKAFFLPEVGKGIIFSAFDTPEKPGCAIAVQQLDAKKFIEQVDYWFDPTQSPFQIKQSVKVSDSEALRLYEATVAKKNLNITLYIRDYPKSGTLQVDLSAGAVEAQ